MKNNNFSFLLIAFFSFAIAMPLLAQEENDENEKWEFDTIALVKNTSVKSQDRTGTCWDFSTTSFIESELLRKGKGRHDISEMFFVRYSYPVKAQKYLFFHGKHQFAQGGQAHDVMDVVRDFGMIPEEIFNGMNINEDAHNHKEMDAVLKAMMKAVVEHQRGVNITPRWNQALEGILDAYLGEVPEKFEYNRQEFTPKSFAQEMGINADDYIELTSFSYYPFYEECILEIPDNWSLAKYYNLPIDDFMAVIYHALENDYSLVWDGDVSDTYFTHKNGVAYVPKEKWNRYMDESEGKFVGRYHEEVDVVSQADRDQTIYNQSTTDDHLMHLVGVSQDQHGTKYFITKNSWGTKGNDLGGYLHMSDKYVRLRTIAVLVHKDALPKNIAKKLGIK